jgi:hypothetical protein
MTNATLKAVAAAGVAVLLGMSQQAGAATQQRLFMQGATGPCDAVNPVSDSKLSRTSTGLRNVATTNVLIGCSMLGDEASTGPAAQVFIYFKNHTGTTKNITCTLATTPYWGISFSNKTITLAGNGYDYLEWTPGNYPSTIQARVMNLQCTLPPGISAREIGVRYNEDVGA